jgi:hypothetical protein
VVFNIILPGFVFKGYGLSARNTDFGENGGEVATNKILFLCFSMGWL